MRRCLSQANHVDQGLIAGVRICMHDYHDFEPPAHHYCSNRAPPFLSIGDPIPERFRQWVGKDLRRQREPQPMLRDVQALFVFPPCDLHEAFLPWRGRLRRKHEDPVNGGFPVA